MLSRRTHDQPISIKLTFEFNLIACIGERQSSACRNGLRASDAKSDGDTRLFSWGVRLLDCGRLCFTWAGGARVSRRALSKPWGSFPNSRFWVSSPWSSFAAPVTKLPEPLVFGKGPFRANEQMFALGLGDCRFFSGCGAGQLRCRTSLSTIRALERVPGTLFGLPSKCPRRSASPPVGVVDGTAALPERCPGGLIRRGDLTRFVSLAMWPKTFGDCSSWLASQRDGRA